MRNERGQAGLVTSYSGDTAELSGRSIHFPVRAAVTMLCINLKINGVLNGYHPPSYRCMLMYNDNRNYVIRKLMHGLQGILHLLRGVHMLTVARRAMLLPM